MEDTNDNAEMQKSLDYYKGKVEKLNKENQNLRSVRNDALRQSHVLNKVVKAHNIDFDTSKADLNTLFIEDNEVKGDFEYSPAVPARSDAKAPVQNNTSNSLSLDDLKQMSVEQINSRWDEVTNVLKGN